MADCPSIPAPFTIQPDRALSSAVEHYLDMVGVTGSIPVAPTTCFYELKQVLTLIRMPRISGEYLRQTTDRDVGLRRTNAARSAFCARYLLALSKSVGFARSGVRSLVRIRVFRLARRCAFKKWSPKFA